MVTGNPIPQDIVDKLKNRTINDVIFGIRPEHINISPKVHDESFKVQITVLEFLGAETIITFEFPNGTSGMVAVSGFYTAKMGDNAYISFPSNKIHIFDKETEMNLIHS